MALRPTRLLTLPPQPTPFIGRDRETTEICALLAKPACQLLTVVGPGGIGKTRLAIHVAQHILDMASPAITFAHGIIFVSLAPVMSPGGIVSAVADAAGFTFSGDVSPTQQLLDYLQEKELLLILDNIEHSASPHSGKCGSI